MYVCMYVGYVCIYACKYVGYVYMYACKYVGCVYVCMYVHTGWNPEWYAYWLDIMGDKITNFLHIIRLGLINFN
jgi:hypothetical protein